MSEYNEIKIVNGSRSRNEYRPNSVTTGVNPSLKTTPLVEPNTPKRDVPHVAKKKQRRVAITAKVLSAVVAVAGASMVVVAVADELDILNPLPIVQRIFTESNAQAELFEDVGSISYTIHIVDYTPTGTLTLAVLDTDGQRVWEIPFAQSSEDGTTAHGVVTDLGSGRAYTFCLYEDDRLLWTRAFLTQQATQPAPSYIVENADAALDSTQSAVMFSIGLPDYVVFSGLKARLSAGDFSSELMLEAETEENTVYVHGEFTDLSSETKYAFELYDGDRLVYVNDIWTKAPDSGGLLANAQVSFATTEIEVMFSVGLPDYTVETDLVARLSDVTGADALEEKLEPQLDGATTVASGHFADLTPATKYLFELYDGERLLYQEEVLTKEPSYLLDDAEIGFEYSDSVLYYYVTLTDYTIVDAIQVAVGATEDDKIYSTPTPETEDNYIHADGEIEGLTDGVTYTLYLYDGNRLLAQRTFTMGYYDVNLDGATVELFPGTDGLTYHFVLPSDYTVNESLRIEVSSLAGTQSAEVEPTVTEDGVEGEGEIEGLSPSTEYDFALYDGDEILWSEQFTTGDDGSGTGG